MSKTIKEKLLHTATLIEETSKALGISKDRVRSMHKELIELGLIQEVKVAGKKGTFIKVITK